MRRNFLLISLLFSCAAAAGEPAVRQAISPEDAQSAAFWLRRGVGECQALEGRAAPRGGTTRGTPGGTFVSPLNLIALGQGQAGDTEGLRQTLEVFRADAAAQEDAARKCLAYATLAGHALALNDQAGYRGDLARAKEAAASVDGEYMRPIVDLQLAQLQARAGDFAAARLIAGETFEPVSKASQYCALAWLAHQQGDSDLADGFARMARRFAGDQDEATASTILLRLGQVQAARYNFVEARYCADEIPQFAARAELYRTMARLEAKAGDRATYRDTLAAARDTAARAGGSEQVWQLSLLCRTEFEANDQETAERTLHAAIVAAESLTSATEKVSAWFDVADAQASLRDVRGCRKSIIRAQELLVDLPPRPIAPLDRARRHYVAVVLSLARSGEADAVAELARPITEPQDLSAIYWALGDAQSRAGSIEAAQQSVGKIREPMYRAFACRRLARAYALRHDLAGLTQWIDTLGGPEERSWAALGAAEGLLGRRVFNPEAGAMAQLEQD